MAGSVGRQDDRPPRDRAGRAVERARHWQYEELPGVDLLRARYVRKTFVRHTHENFVIAAIADGVEVFHHAGSDVRAGAGALALVNPDTPHTGRAGVPEGWRYGAVYPAPEVVAAIAAETSTLRGAPASSAPSSTTPPPSTSSTRCSAPWRRATRCPPTPCSGSP
ncbi:AraC family ligand binding domain-containing protein [Streptomyces malaysiense]|uniref:AraC family ligand binding domain-containing protein n=1 Tax=Streptomyces malaysiense TaxID=1428626 RepID=UPI000A8F2D25|nr:AraC family ligand binding domain-containing protein [Streptomyces malaysiense]